MTKRQHVFGRSESGMMIVKENLVRLNARQKTIQKHKRRFRLSKHGDGAIIFNCAQMDEAVNAHFQNFFYRRASIIFILCNENGAHVVLCGNFVDRRQDIDVKRIACIRNNDGNQISSARHQTTSQTVWNISGFADSLFNLAFCFRTDVRIVGQHTRNGGRG